MNKYIPLLALISYFLLSCSSYEKTENYFGYEKPENEKPKEVKVENKTSNDTDSQDEDWVNPLSSENQENVYTESSEGKNLTVINNYYSHNRNYVPVVVPWWYDYYGRFSNRRNGVFVTLSYGNGWGYDWYSPWYRYHPYYGVSWDYYNRNFYRSYWYRQPVYSYERNRIDRREYSRFGPSRGKYGNQEVSRRNNYIRDNNDYNRSSRERGSNVYSRTSGSRESGSRRGYDRSSGNSRSKSGVNNSGTQSRESYRRSPSRNSGSSLRQKGNNPSSRSGSSGRSGSSRKSGGGSKSRRR